MGDSEVSEIDGDFAKQKMLEILEKYRNMPFLYDKSHKLYLSQKKRDEAFQELFVIYQDLYKHGTVRMLKKKLTNMRTSYIKELRKVIASKQTATDPKEVHVPTLWYFNAMSFLEDTLDGGVLYRSMNDPLRSDVSYDVTTEDHEYSFRQRTEGFQESLDSSAEDSPGPSKKKLRLSSVKSDEFQEFSMSSHEAGTSKPRQAALATKDEELKLLGKSVAIQLRGVDKLQLTICRKLISDAIYYASINKLTVDSKISLNYETDVVEYLDE